jgi:hypothetical protein
MIPPPSYGPGGGGVMARSYGVMAGLLAVAFGAGIYVGSGVQAQAQQSPIRVLEVRKYTTNDGRLDALVKRMREHEAGFFAKYGMKNVFHGVAAEGPEAGNTYLYVLGHESREAATKSWAAFRQDKEWPVFRAQSEADGAILKKADVTWYNAVDVK